MGSSFRLQLDESCYSVGYQTLHSHGVLKGIEFLLANCVAGLLAR